MKNVSILDCSPFSGRRIKPFEGELRYLSTGDLQESSIKFEQIDFKNRPSRADIVVSEGDIIYARMKGTNKVLLINKEYEGIIVSTGFAVHHPTANYYSPYIESFIKTKIFSDKKDKYCTGAIQPAITNTGIKKLKIPIPKKFEDQIRIAKVLTKAEGLITKRKESIKLLDELIKSTFLEMFGDPGLNPKDLPLRKLSEFYVNKKDGTKCGPFGSALKKNEYSLEGIPVWVMDNISKDGHFISKVNLWINENKYQELENYKTINGDIIISRAGTVGKMCIVNTVFEKSIISTNLIRLRFGNELISMYFICLMTYFRGRVGRLKTGADGTFTHMNTGILDKLKIPYPELEQQNKFAEIVEKIESIKNNYQNNLSELENLYGSLSQRAFKGELDLSKVEVEIEEKIDDFVNLA